MNATPGMDSWARSVLGRRMSLRTVPWPPGMPCWADLSVPDVAQAREFYAGVLGWAFEDSGEEYGGYVIAQVAGDAVAGVGPLMTEGQPSAWTLYLASDDADATAAAIAEHGGSVLVPPGDVGPMGRMLIAADPSGAAFGVWQAKEMIGAGRVNEPGALTWDDLRSSDPAVAQAFYAAVFGYAIAPMPGAPDQDYRLFLLPGDDAPLGGMGGMMGAVGVPPHWLVYFAAADVDVALTEATRLGGSVLVPAFDTQFGRMGGVTDPFGAVFWVAQITGPQPDRSDP